MNFITQNKNKIYDCWLQLGNSLAVYFWFVVWWSMCETKMYLLHRMTTVTVQSRNITIILNYTIYNMGGCSMRKTSTESESKSNVLCLEVLSVSICSWQGVYRLDHFPGASHEEDDMFLNICSMKTSTIESE